MSDRQRSYVPAILAVALLCLPATTDASESQLRESMRSMKRSASKLIDACRKLKDNSRGLHRKMQSVRKAPSTFKNIREKIYQVKSATPTICTRIETYGYRTRNYADKIWNGCLSCLGKGRCSGGRSHHSRCVSDYKYLQSTLREFGKWQDKYVYQAEKFQTQIKRLKRLR